MPGERDPSISGSFDPTDLVPPTPGMLREVTLGVDKALLLPEARETITTVYSIQFEDLDTQIEATQHFGFVGEDEADASFIVHYSFADPEGSDEPDFQKNFSVSFDSRGRLSFLLNDATREDVTIARDFVALGSMMAKLLVGTIANPELQYDDRYRAQVSGLYGVTKTLMLQNPDEFLGTFEEGSTEGLIFPNADIKEITEGILAAMRTTQKGQYANNRTLQLELGPDEHVDILDRRMYHYDDEGQLIEDELLTQISSDSTPSAYDGARVVGVGVTKLLELRKGHAPKVRDRLQPYRVADPNAEGQIEYLRSEEARESDLRREAEKTATTGDIKHFLGLLDRLQQRVA